MKKIITLIALFIYTSSFSQTLNQEVKDDNGSTKLLGVIDKNGLTKAPYNDWFTKNYDNYKVNEALVNSYKDSLNTYTIKAFLGTWCGDSKREVPRFYKVLETANFDLNNLKVFALDNTKENYKKGPNGEEDGYNIHRVPTFIFYKNEKEVNRIVEYPKETLERDIENIVTNKRYFPNYFVANTMFYNILNNPLENLKQTENQFLPYFAEYVNGSKELNTLGYVLLRAKKTEEALFVFEINTKLFPFNYNVYDSLAEAYYNTNNYNEAIKNYYKVLSMNPDNENAKNMIEMINAKKQKTHNN